VDLVRLAPALAAEATPVTGRTVPQSPAATTARNKRLLILLAAIALAPIVLSYLAYYVFPRSTRINYGELLQQPPVALQGTRLDGTPFDLAALRGRWIVLFAGGAACEGACADRLYASRQSRTMQNAERDRIQRVWLLADDGAPSAATLADHPDVLPVRVASTVANRMPQGPERIYLIDPLGNFVLAWPAKPDIKAMAADLARLLRASRIG
jgi:hypothetical protein